MRKLAAIFLFYSFGCSSPDFSAGHEHPVNPTVRKNPLTERWEQTHLGDYCHVGECDGGSHEGEKSKLRAMGIVVRGAIGWTCNYAYIPADGWKDGIPCLPQVTEQNIRHGSAHTTADDERMATNNFHLFIWPGLRSTAGRPEHGALLVSVKCRPSAGVH